MDKSAMKKVLAGLSVAGLVAGVTLTGCQKANGSCGAGSCSKTEKVEGEDAAEGKGSCAGMEDTSSHGTGSCAGMKDNAETGEGSQG